MEKVCSGKTGRFLKDAAVREYGFIFTAKHHRSVFMNDRVISAKNRLTSSAMRLRYVRAGRAGPGKRKDCVRCCHAVLHFTGFVQNATLRGADAPQICAAR